jgi:solute carrier family 13 (sodium-dependent dicarboxylate transporter), member 2/3/5
MRLDLFKGLNIRPFLPSVRGFGLSLALVVLIVGVVSPSPDGMTHEIQLVLTVFFFALILWLTKAIPYALSSVLSVTLLFTLNITDTFEEAVIGYASTLVFFLFVLLLLGNSISKVKLDERVAKGLLSSQSTPRRTIRSLASNLLVLSFLMPSAMARTVTFIPVVRRLATAYGLEQNSEFTRSSFILLGHVNPIASMALMTGGGMAIITSEIINSTIRTVTWVEWAIAMIPPTLALYCLSAISAERIYGVNDTATVEQDSDGMKLAKEEAPPLTRDQRIVGVVMIGAILGWIIGSFVGLPTIVPAIGAGAILALPGIDIITTDDIRDVSWGVLFLIGAMFSILNVMETSGTLVYVVDGITQHVSFSSLPMWQAVTSLLVLAVCIRVFFSTASAAIVIVLPIILEFGEIVGANSLYLALSVLIIIGSTTFLPFNTSAVLISFDRGPLTNREVVGFGFVTMCLSTIVIALSWLFYWPLVI